MYYQTRKSLGGFALAEMLISLAAVTLAIALVAGLGQQVMQLARSSKQTAAVVELRSKSTAITRNLDSWLSKLRSSPLTGGIYSACIPDPSNPVSVHFCPDVNPDLLANDSELKRIAGTQLHAASVPLLDMLGEKLAGTVDAPVLYDLDGRTCTSNCALKATGFMLRSNPASDSNPGSVRFVVKVEPHSRAKGQSPIRTSYLTIDVGSEWQQPTGLCPSGSIKVGYLSNGKPSCINPTKKCAAGKVHLGLDQNANPICKTPPASCATAGGSVVINAEGSDLVCATNMSEIPCQASEIFLGYYAGTGVPMCSGTNLSCPDGEVQIGIRQEGASLQAQCKKLPSCQDSQKLSYDGSQFVCQSAQVASTCQAGEVVVGINEDGSAKCEVQERNLASTNLNCPTGKYVAGLEPDGSVKCSELPTTAVGGYTGEIWECTCSNLNVWTLLSNSDQSGRYCSGNGAGAVGISTTYWQCRRIHGGESPATPNNPTPANQWPQTLTCTNGDNTIYPSLHSKGIDISGGSTNVNHINYMYPAKEGGSLILTYNVNTGSFIRIIGQYGQGPAPGNAAEGCKRNILNPGSCQKFTNYPQTSVTFANGTSQSYRTHSRDPSLTQFCVGKGYSTYSNVIEENYYGILALHNGRGWETNSNGMSIKEITCCK